MILFHILRIIRCFKYFSNLNSENSENSNPLSEQDSAASTSTPQSGSSAGSPPKLTREKVACLPPRRRLFSRTEEENMPVAATVPVPAPQPAIASSVPARASGFRSSSETSVFDFRESDSEGEMPVLERQTLEEMRRDRKQLSKVQPPVPLNDAMCMGMTSSSDLVKIELKVTLFAYGCFSRDSFLFGRTALKSNRLFNRV